MSTIFCQAQFSYLIAYYLIAPYCGRVYPADYNHKVSVCNQYLDAVLENTER